MSTRGEEMLRFFVCLADRSTEHGDDLPHTAAALAALLVMVAFPLGILIVFLRRTWLEEDVGVMLRLRRPGGQRVRR